ncbi:hypothetical protein AB0N24_20675 [Arthrobacter sp. NPDC093128]|uniref:hypothetical protein n=1 Tax=Arthrobacter sp. NPDC093128 TaxID=3154979 RepID=UPI0034316A98
METSREAVNFARSGHPKAVELVRESGQLHGEVLVTAVICSTLGYSRSAATCFAAEDHLMSGLRERLHQPAQPLATRTLQILTSQLGDRSGAVGTARLAIEELFAPHAVEAYLAADVPVVNLDDAPRAIV